MLRNSKLYLCEEIQMGSNFHSVFLFKISASESKNGTQNGEAVKEISGRRMNDSMGQYVASEVIKLMLKNDLKVIGANILVLGITFKEDCPDVRNNKAVDVVKGLQSYGTNITIYDPFANPAEVKHEYNLETTQELPSKKFDATVLTVAHTKRST